MEQKQGQKDYCKEGLESRSTHNNLPNPRHIKLLLLHCSRFTMRSMRYDDIRKKRRPEIYLVIEFFLAVN